MSGMAAGHATASWASASPHSWLDTHGPTTNTLAQWRMTGAGPTFIRIGRRVRYRPDDVNAWIDSQARRSTCDPGRPT
jgi:hypothetical protein